MSRKMLRTENLIALFERFGGAAGISRECKKNGVTIDPVTIGQIKNGTPLPSGNPRGIGDKLADKLEKGLLLPARWMDTPNATSETGTMQSVAINPSTESLGTFTAQKVARELETLSENGKLTDDQIKSISSLIKTFTED